VARTAAAAVWYGFFGKGIIDRPRPAWNEAACRRRHIILRLRATNSSPTLLGVDWFDLAFT
jgi:hypothetical protein